MVHFLVSKAVYPGTYYKRGLSLNESYYTWRMTYSISIRDIDYDEYFKTKRVKYLLILRIFFALVSYDVTY